MNCDFKTSKNICAFHFEVMPGDCWKNCRFFDEYSECRSGDNGN